MKLQEITWILYKDIKLTEMYATESRLFSEKHHLFHLKQEAKTNLKLAIMIKKEGVFVL